LDSWHPERPQPAEKMMLASFRPMRNESIGLTTTQIAGRSLAMSFSKRALRLRAIKLVRRDFDLAEFGKTGARATRHELRTIRAVIAKSIQLCNTAPSMRRKATAYPVAGFLTAEKRHCFAAKGLRQ
jgi:predicted metalloendopeptidase